MDKIQIKLLKKILSIQTSSEDDTRLIKYITDFLSSIKLPYFKDDYGNIYVIKGKSDKYPCVVSHVDTVHDILNFVKIFQSDEILFAFNKIKGKQCGIGGDDKVGVFLALQLLLNSDIKELKVVFYRKEEGGRLGSKYSILNNKDFYKDCNYVIQCDRYGRHDLINKIGFHKIASDEFLNDIDHIMKKYNYKTYNGISTDVLSLYEGKIGISCVNVSCGYYLHHTDHEVVNIDDVENTYLFVLDIIKEIKKKYIHRYDDSLESMNYSTINTKYFFIKKHNRYHIKGYKDNIFIPIIRQCKGCLQTNVLYIDVSSTKGDIYCVECGLNIPDNHKKLIYKNLYLHNNYLKMVYSTALNTWLLESASVFNNKINSYIRNI